MCCVYVGCGCISVCVGRWGERVTVVEKMWISVCLQVYECMIVWVYWCGCGCVDVGWVCMWGVLCECVGCGCGGMSVCGCTCRKSLVTRFNATAGGTWEGARTEDTPEEGTVEVRAAVRLLLSVPATAGGCNTRGGGGTREVVREVAREVTKKGGGGYKGGITMKIVTRCYER